MFMPTETDEDDAAYRDIILSRQSGFFGLFPDRYSQLSKKNIMPRLRGIEEIVAEIGGREAFRNTLENCFSGEALGFLDRVMKLDPRERPTAPELLGDSWLEGVAV